MNTGQALEQILALRDEIVEQRGHLDWQGGDLRRCITLDNARRRFGYCSYRSATISLSRHLVALNGWDEVKATMIHAMAHAIAGPDAGHGPEWAEVDRSLGGSGDRCYDDSVVRPVGRYAAHRGGCGVQTTTRLRLHRSMRARGAYTSRCCRADIKWVDTVTNSAVTAI